MFKKNIMVKALLVAFGFTPLVHADSTLVYEMSDKSGAKKQHTISISGRWLRLESGVADKSKYTVMDLGRMLKFDVDDNTKTFQLTRMGRLYWPATALTAPMFKPVPKKNVVSGVRCQPVNEMAMDHKSVAKHCMATGGSLGLNAREMITLSRLFMSARRIGLNWPGVATPDERQVSILSQNSDGVTQQFKSVVHQRIENTKFKVPVNYKRLNPDLPLKKNN